MMMEPERTPNSAAADGLCGPDELVRAVLTARDTAEWEKSFFGDISGDGLRQLIRLAYFAGQAPNEGHYPRMRLLVPARSVRVEVDVPLSGRLSVAFLQRVSPGLGLLRQALLVREQDGVLVCDGIVTTTGALTDLKLGDPLFPDVSRPSGLHVELLAPGEVRAGEHRRHRIHAGTLYQEKSFTLDSWFEAWCRPATVELFGCEEAATAPIPGWRLIPRFAVSAVWMKLLNLAAAHRHGGCFAILPAPSQAPLRPVFGSSGCDLGAALVGCGVTPIPRQDMAWGTDATSEAEARHRLRAKQHLLSTVEAVANLSATDGCVVLNRCLQLHSFGSMIEATDAAGDPVPAYLGDSEEPLDSERVRSFGARRRSALALCRACPGSLVFVISQDGDLRAFAHRDGAVRLYDHLAYW